MSRLRGTYYLLKHALLTVPGDVAETGLFQGGSGILMALMLHSWDFCGHRRYWGFDSFRGLPRAVAADMAGSATVGAAGQMAVARDVVEANFKAAGVNMSSGLVTLIPGWFNETLPGAAVRHIAFLRLDGDMFTSTRDALVNLYDKVVPGGLVYVDDYGSFNGCKMAVDIFRKQRGITQPLHWIRELAYPVEAVWWRKPLREHPLRGGGGGGGGSGGCSSSGGMDD
ncbi:hypothetical protein HYH03_003867 [Edaphochlamys debaryana]|uniref:Macrocin O-methyltransferase n=1 Tax=Edaphochlamys debaryana TaxID=47281 RepID=A0A835YI73_9CHLO|nr:hypothetical protein HYH03_003867 [Edaphochlamys debaryana]|eukprot:KAG2498109.1 hypothetical protein HYH03_003867 [Edaphochlamys debaryana]